MRSGTVNISNRKIAPSTISLNVEVFLPVIWDKLFLQADITFLRHSLIPGNDTAAQNLQINGMTSNYIFLGYLGVAFPLAQRLSVHPKLGAGYTLQSTQISGNIDMTFSNGFFIFGPGADLLFSINKNLDANLGVISLAEIEGKVMTLVLQGQLGIRLKI